MAKSLFSKSWLQCLLFLIGGGLISMILKFEVIWDFAQYHYYNAWALTEGRFNYDLLVAGYNGFFNPVIDVPLYYLIKYFNDYPNLIYFVQGLWFGALGFVVFKIAELFFVDKRAVFFSLLFGLCGYGVFFQIGTASNEIMIAFLLLSALYLLLRVFCGKNEAKASRFFIAGLLAGSAMGLKLTAIIYCVPMGICLILFYKKIPEPFKNISFFAFGGLFGVLLFGGYWFWLCWTHFQNPLFPFANGVFDSEYWNGGNYTDDRFVPKSLSEFLFLPFKLRRGEGFDVVFDFRLAFLYGAILIWPAKYLKNKNIHINVPFAFVCLFVFISYLIWIVYFSIVRYMLPIEILSALILVKAAICFVPSGGWQKDIYQQFLFACGLLLLLTPLFSDIFGCRNCSFSGGNFSKFVDVEDVKLPDNTLILFYRYPNNYPVSALLAYWAQTTKDLRGAEATPGSYRNGFFSGGVWHRQRDEILKRHKDPKAAVLAVEKEQDVGVLKEENIELKDMDCLSLKTNMVTPHYIYFLCTPPNLMSEI